MSESRIDKAMARISAAVSRIDAAREDVVAGSASSAAKHSASSTRVMELVNRHEKLREEVAETLTDLDAIIEDLES
jgi:hypothetical protein